MKFNEMNFDEKREYFRQRIRGGEKSAINKQRANEAKAFHKRFHKKMKDENIEQEER